MGDVGVTKSVKWVGIALILMVGLIHFADAPDSYSGATCKGLMFTANGVGALVAAGPVSTWIGATWAGTWALSLRSGLSRGT